MRVKPQQYIFSYFLPLNTNISFITVPNPALCSCTKYSWYPTYAWIRRLTNASWLNQLACYWNFITTTRVFPNPPCMLIVLNTVAFKTPFMTPSCKSSGSSRLTASHIEIFSLCFSTSHNFYCMPLEMSYLDAIFEQPQHSWELHTTILHRKHVAH